MNARVEGSQNFVAHTAENKRNNPHAKCVSAIYLFESKMRTNQKKTERNLRSLFARLICKQLQNNKQWSVELLESVCDGKAEE